MRKCCLFAFCSIALAGCDQPDQDQRLANYLKHNLGIASTEQMPKAIFVLTEDGCPACDRAFADAIRPYGSSPNCLFVIRAEGRSVNMTGFLEQTDRIRYDDGSFKELSLLPASGVIIIHDGAVDTIISLHAAEIRAQIGHVNALLRELQPQVSPD